MAKSPELAGFVLVLGLRKRPSGFQRPFRRRCLWPQNSVSRQQRQRQAETGSNAALPLGKAENLVLLAPFGGRTVAINSLMISSSIPPGWIPFALAKWPKRESPRLVRLPKRWAKSWRHSGLRATFRSALTGSSPLAFTAATKSERILAKRLGVIPTAIGLTPPRPSLIVSIARGLAAGVLPSR